MNRKYINSGNTVTVELLQTTGVDCDEFIATRVWAKDLQRKLLVMTELFLDGKCLGWNER